MVTPRLIIHLFLLNIKPFKWKLVLQSGPTSEDVQFPSMLD